MKNIDAILERLVGQADYGPGTFLEKLERQLSVLGPGCVKLVADAYAIYELYPSRDRFGPARKTANIVRIASWGGADATLPRAMLDKVFDQGIGGCGIRYLNQSDRQLACILWLGRILLDGPLDATNDTDLKAAITAAEEASPQSAPVAAALRHLFFPDSYEPMVSKGDRDLVIAAFAEYAGEADDPDSKLARIRSHLHALRGPFISFYDPAIRDLWDDTAVEVATVPEADVSVPVVGETPDEPADTRLLGDHLRLDNLELSDTVVPGVLAALRADHHVVLTGPPGTGKTRLATLVAEAAERAGLCAGYDVVTASAEWSAFDTLGGYMPDPATPQRLVFVPGIVLRAIQNNRWLILDEVNRAEADKAFGAMLTVLSGSSVVLPYFDAEGHEVGIENRPERGASRLDGTSGRYQVGRNWRIIATMNTRDKNSLYALSYALMRRFSFVYVGAPPTASYASLLDGVGVSPVARNMAIALTAACTIPLGPAILIDFAKSLDAHDSPDAATCNAVIAYVLPQLEGLDSRPLSRELLAIAKALGAPSSTVAVWRAMMSLEPPVGPSSAAEILGDDDEPDIDG